MFPETQGGQNVSSEKDKKKVKTCHQLNQFIGLSYLSLPLRLVAQVIWFASFFCLRQLFMIAMMITMMMITRMAT
jgi:hypothetical protein